MIANLLAEPSLEFAGGIRHIDPRFGISEYGPADLASPAAPRTIKVGVIGSQAAISETQQWLTACQRRIEGKRAERPGLWPAWPGFSPDVGYRAELVFDPRLQRPLKGRALEELDKVERRRRGDAAVGLFVEELRMLVHDGRPDVVICAIPDQVIELEESPPPGERPDAIDSETAESVRPASFHDLLKARAMPLRVPLQLLRASTYDPTRARAQRRKSWKLRQREDDATVAWNFLTALYYKAGGTPWRMVRSPTDLDACYGFACDCERVLVAGIAVAAALRGIARLPTDLLCCCVGHLDACARAPGLRGHQVALSDLSLGSRRGAA